MLAEKFTSIFREEHRQVRDLLLDLVQAFQARDRARINAGLEALASLTGPHFRYEEESLYPELRAFFNAEYVEKLLGDHDMAIGFAKKLVALAGKAELSDNDVQRAVYVLQSIMPHVSDCDGLSILVETLPQEKIQNMLDTRDRAREQGLNLIEWADHTRERPLPSMPSLAG